MEQRKKRDNIFDNFSNIDEYIEQKELAVDFPEQDESAKSRSDATIIKFNMRFNIASSYTHWT